MLYNNGNIKKKIETIVNISKTFKYKTYFPTIFFSIPEIFSLTITIIQSKQKKKNITIKQGFQIMFLKENELLGMNKTCGIIITVCIIISIVKLEYS